MNPLLIYVAGPYSAKSAQERRFNVERAMVAGMGLIDLGHWPFIPHLTHYFDAFQCKIEGTSYVPELYMQWDFAMLRRCDGLLYLAPSPGADRELALADELGLPVWRDVEEIPAP